MGVLFSAALRMGVKKERDLDRNCGRVSLWRVQWNHPPNPRNIQEKYGWNGFVSES